ncbi:uncharacterized protein [Henckelia pumila]|uniref:uncharacterized protein n=1 Tax=Henckelia pumila TaxID=405737 RepID=UPI003C6E1159
MNMLDAASGGVFVDKTPVQARNLIENMAANSQQFGTNRSDPATEQGNEVNVSSLEQQLIELTNFVRQMAIGIGQNVRACGVCAKVGHAIDMCPTLQEGSAEQVNAVGGWKDHPNLRYENPPVHQPHNQAYRRTPYHPPQPQCPQVPTPGEFLENIVKDLATNTVTFQQETRAIIQQLNTQIGQLATAAKRLEALNSNSLPSQTVVNPKENVSAITLRSERELKVHEEVVKEPIGDIQLDTVMLDLGASLNVMTYSVYDSLNLGPLNKTEIVIQMADRSTIYPRGLLEDVLVQVDNLVFPADFYVLDMKSNDLNSPILLGRPFPKTSKSIIDVNNGTLTMEFDREVVKFHIFDTLQIPDCESVVNNLDAINHLSQKHKKVVNGDKVKEVIARPIENFTAESFRSDLQVPRKSKQRKQRPKITAILRKWVKVVRKTRYEPP